MLGWTILNFLEHMKFGDGAEDVANLFETGSEIGLLSDTSECVVKAWFYKLPPNPRHWKDFISMSPRDIMRIPAGHLYLPTRQRFLHLCK